MRIWIDIENPPQVQYLIPFKAGFEALGHDVVVTAQDHPFTLDLLRERDVEVCVMGGRTGGAKAKRVARILGRTSRLSRVLRGLRPDLLVATSRSAVLSGWNLRIPSFTFCDYEHTDFSVSRLTRARIFHPDVIDEWAFTSRGVRRSQLIPFAGLKETISFSGIDLDGTPAHPLPAAPARTVPRVLFRPPGEETHYYAPESGEVALQVLGWLAERGDVVVVYVPRYSYQEAYLKRYTWTHEPVVLREAIPFLRLLKAVDAVVSSGGTMLREAAYLGLPSYSIFRSEIGQVDRYLKSIGRLRVIETSADVDHIDLAPRSLRPLPASPDLIPSMVQTMVESSRRR